MIKRFLNTNETLNKMVVRADVKKTKPIQDNPRLGDRYQEPPKQKNDRRGSIEERRSSPRKIHINYHDLRGPKELILTIMQSKGVPFEWPAKHRRPDSPEIQMNIAISTGK